MKTLKDLEQDGYILRPDLDCRKVRIVTLKKEAIKWIKHIEKDIVEIRKVQHRALLECSIIGGIATKGLDEVLGAQINWIKMFFNISEEDLK